MVEREKNMKTLEKFAVFASGSASRLVDMLDNAGIAKATGRFISLVIAQNEYLFWS